MAAGVPAWELAKQPKVWMEWYLTATTVTNEAIEAIQQKDDHGDSSG